MTLKSKIKTKLREGDEVIVLAGRDVGKTGNILKIAGKNKALVSGINMIAIDPGLLPYIALL